MRWPLVVVAMLGALMSAVVGTAVGTSTPWWVSLIGLGGGALLIVGSKQLGSRWLRRDERYYDLIATDLTGSDLDEGHR